MRAENDRYEKQQGSIKPFLRYDPKTHGPKWMMYSPKKGWYYVRHVGPWYGPPVMQRTIRAILEGRRDLMAKKDVAPGAAAMFTQSHIRAMSRRLAVLGEYKTFDYGRVYVRNGRKVNPFAIGFRDGRVTGVCELDQKDRIVAFRIGLPPVVKEGSPAVILKRLGYALLDGQLDLIDQDLSPKLRKAIQPVVMQRARLRLQSMGRLDGVWVDVMVTLTDGTTTGKVSIRYNTHTSPHGTMSYNSGNAECVLDRNGRFTSIFFDGANLASASSISWARLVPRRIDPSMRDAVGAAFGRPLVEVPPSVLYRLLPEFRTANLDLYRGMIRR